MATIYKMDLCPNQDGYSVQHGYGIIRQQLEGGASRFRKNKKNVPSIVNVSWLVEKDGYDYLKAFYEIWQNQDEAFLLDLIIDDAELLEYSCNFTGGIVLNSVLGYSYRVSAELEAKTKKRNPDQDEIIILGVLDLVNPLEELVNEDLANALEDFNG